MFVPEILMNNNEIHLRKQSPVGLLGSVTYPGKQSPHTTLSLEFSHLLVIGQPP